jgi:hypothetical protein
MDGKRELGLLPKPAEDRHEAVYGEVKRSRSTLRMRTNSPCAIPVRASGCRIDRFSASRTLMDLRRQQRLGLAYIGVGTAEVAEDAPLPRAIPYHRSPFTLMLLTSSLGRRPVRVAR